MNRYRLALLAAVFALSSPAEARQTARRSTVYDHGMVSAADPRAAEAGAEVSVAVLEKGSEVGAHILSGAVIDPKALNELIPDWQAKGAPLETPGSEDRYLMLDRKSTR